MEDSQIKDFQESLLNWFNQNGRCYPWRKTIDPYSILIAEKLLQQTAAREVVITVYQNMLTNFSSPKELANADIESLRRIIQPLGLVYRANDLLQMGKELVEKYNGEIPNDLPNLLLLKGIGDYIARAVLCFAFNNDIPVVDVNVARFLYRINGITDKFPTNPSRKKSLIIMAGRLIPTGKSKQFNWAILDLCALLCTPMNPHCYECPIIKYCKFGNQKLIPFRSTMDPNL